MSSVTVVGAGAWGTALALQAFRAGNAVSLTVRDDPTADMIMACRQSQRLPGFTLPGGIDVVSALPREADILIWAVPTQSLRASLRHYRPAGKPIVVCAKGVETGTRLLPLEIVAAVATTCPTAVLTGPNFAGEVAQGLPTAAVVAGLDVELRQKVRSALGTSTFRLYTSGDPIGAQVGGAAKNVIAIAAGAVLGAGLGENARAALVTRGLSEIRRLAVSSGGMAETIMGLSGLGDLLLTCTGPSSRNFSLGYELGLGRSLAEILAGRLSVTEGLQTAAALVARANDVEMPICSAVADLLAGVKTLDQTIVDLLSRPQRDE